MRPKLMKDSYYHSTIKGLFKSVCATFVIILLPLTIFSQKDSSITLTFDFNSHEIKENDNKVRPKPVGVFLTHDRFGNEKSAVQLMGDNLSYLNLGTSPLFKSSNMSISLWIKINARVHVGKGNDYNPILIIKNKEGFDFTNAIAMGYDCATGHVGINSTKDSLEEAMVSDDYPVIFNKWYHFVLVCNNNYLALYKDGKLIGKTAKNFETQFLASDSLVVGHTASTKNHRFTRDVVDDIKIFHRSLTPEEVLALYKAPNPNAFWQMLDDAKNYILIVLGFSLTIAVVIIRNKRVLKRQKQESELVSKMAEFELRAIKSQMNPHFISNSLAAIQELNYNQDREKAGLYIAKFSYFLRQILNYSDENYISISEEIVMMRLFVELEQLRFNDGFSFDLMVDDSFDTEEVLIPSLITQPFIENAIWHGLLPLKNSRAPKLTVRITKKNGYPIVEIEDNGIGRSPKMNASRKSKGTQLVMDKIDALNRLAKTSNYKINIIDLVSNEGHKLGTKIIIQLDASSD